MLIAELKKVIIKEISIIFQQPLTFQNDFLSFNDIILIILYFYLFINFPV